MLILTRRIGEKIVINGDIIVEVVSINNRGQVILGFVADDEVIIDREEIYERKIREEMLKRESNPRKL